ncbi:hypothetical protein GCM10018980_65250 [Streptomyces capoamus]|uniref:Uncharacterized protein n=1 Tax=Streptomyces capoamus TaxID=68183 RepID=A0A919KFF5_9ACTN|nr:hypothetical protein [Streptomyces capoamus]GGP31357.1 hypothetical protein GCM10010501_72070 [Streptomyces libani subsp. rufus]GHG70566.1 hypothetical protein GCM10018980_65250 [Streptomyces capoamus]
MSGDGKDLATQGLGLIAKGLTDALGELKELGGFGTSGAGRGFGEIALSGLELGHEGLTGAFSSFCERWEWGVRSLIAEGNGFAEKTGLAAGTYYETDKYVEGTVKVAENAAIGNPYASEEDVEKMGYGDIAASGAYGGDVDYSGESFEQAWANSKQGWQTAADDVMTSHTIGPVPGMGVGDLREALGDADAPSRGGER